MKKIEIPSKIVNELLKIELNDSNHEFEVRFIPLTFQREHGHKRYSLSYVEYNRLKTRIGDGQQPVVNLTQDITWKQSRNSQVLRKSIEYINGNPQPATWMVKNKKTVFEDRQYALRYAISSERPVSGLNDSNYQQYLRNKITNSSRQFDQSTRFKRRSSYQLTPKFRLDLTSVNTQTDGQLTTTYEAELEYIPDPNWDIQYILQNMTGQIAIIWKILRDSEMLFELTDFKDLVQFVNRSLDADYGVDRLTFNHRTLFQSRNLHFNDLVSGGIVNNRVQVKNRYANQDTEMDIQHGYSFTVTIKADGVRKLLVFHTVGMWLVFPPHDANLLIRWDNDDQLKSLFAPNIGTILECESIPKENRLNDAPLTRYWLLAYDCLSLPQENPGQYTNRYGNSSVQFYVHSSTTLPSRMNYAQGVAEIPYLRNSQLLTLETKHFSGFTSAAQFFEVMRKMENSKHRRRYVDDGYIFTANEMPYNYMNTYANHQNITVIWKSIQPNVWTDGVNTLRRHGRQLISEGGQFEDGDTFWFTESELVWDQIQSGTSFIYQQQGKRIWFDRPVSCKSNRRIIEDKGYIIDQDPTNPNSELIEHRHVVEKSRKDIPLRLMPLKARVLTKHPDICKWKPPKDLTIDFAIVPFMVPFSDGQKRQVIKLESAGPPITKIKQVKYRDGTMNSVCNSIDNFVDFDGSNRYKFIGDFTLPNMGPVVLGDAKTQSLPSGSVVEYRWNMDAAQGPRMESVRIRFDKTKPNRLIAAQDTWNLIKDPIQIQTLTNGNQFRLMRKYHNRIKSELYRKAFKYWSEQGINYPTILDIGSGRGGDINKWWGHTNRVLAVEPDQDNITEYLDRLTKMTSQKQLFIVEDINKLGDAVSKAIESDHTVLMLKTGGENTHFITQAAQLWLGDKAHIMTMMLSFSFFFNPDVRPDGSTMLQKLQNTIQSNLDTQGPLIYLTIDGAAVRQAFDPHHMLQAGQPSGTMGGGVESDTITLGEATLRYHKNRSQLDINIPDTIVENQTEWLVYMDRLVDGLPGRSLADVRRADKELMLSDPERMLTRLYSSGQIVPTPEISIQLPVPDSFPTITSPGPRETSRQHEITTQLPVVPRVLPSMATGYTQSMIPKTLPMLSSDDQVQQLNLSWYSANPVVRIGCIGDGSCFFHAVLKSFYRPYGINSDRNMRIDIVKQWRLELSKLLSQQDPVNPGRTYYQTTGNGQLVELYNQQKQGLMLEVDYSLSGMQQLLANNKLPVGNEVYTFVSDRIGLNIYVMSAAPTELRYIFDTVRANPNWPSIVITGNDNHYEVVGAVSQTDSGQFIQTVFFNHDDFLLALKRFKSS